MLNLTTALVLAAGDDPGDPSKLIPTGPNFSLFSGLGNSLQLIIGTVLAVIIVIGIFVLLSGISKFRVGNKNTGQGAKGVTRIVSGIIMIVAALIAIPIINLIISAAQSAGKSIN